MSTHSGQRLVVTLPPFTPTPREYRRRFALALRESVLSAARTNRLDPALAEECWRVIPPPENA